MSRPSSFPRLPDGGGKLSSISQIERRTHEQPADLRRLQSPSRALASPRRPPPWEPRDGRFTGIRNPGLGTARRRPVRDHRVHGRQQRHAQRRRRRQLRLDRDSEPGRGQRESRGMVSHRHDEQPRQVAISRDEPSAQRLPRRVRLGEKPAHARRAVAHEFQTQRQWRVSGPRRTGRFQHRFAVRTRFPAASGGHLLWPRPWRRHGHFARPRRARPRLRPAERQSRSHLDRRGVQRCGLDQRNDGPRL